MIITLLQKTFSPIFGNFEYMEFKKFIHLGSILSCIIGSYWTLCILRNAIFVNFVGASQLPMAKTISIFILFLLIIGYTKMLDTFSCEKVFYILSIFYGSMTMFFALLIINLPLGKTPIGFAYYGTSGLIYALYIFIESYGSLMISLFWAFATTITKPKSAKKGFSLIVAIGQIGGIIGPYFISRLPRQCGFATNGFSIFICAILIFMAFGFFYYFLHTTPPELLVAYTSENEIVKEQGLGFLESLKLIISHKYLLGIFVIAFFFESIVIMFDLHFQVLAASTHTGVAHTEYLGSYGTMVNILTLIFLIFGINNITRIFGIAASLALVPIIIGFAIFGFMKLDSLNFLFALMIGSKAINYALNGPTLKQLYIPTTTSVRFKTQAWISRGSKEAGSAFNMIFISLQKNFGIMNNGTQYALLSSYFCFSLVIIWFFIALYLGNIYKKAIDHNKVVC